MALAHEQKLMGGETLSYLLEETLAQFQVSQYLFNQAMAKAGFKVKVRVRDRARAKLKLWVGARDQVMYSHRVSVAVRVKFGLEPRHKMVRESLGEVSPFLVGYFWGNLSVCRKKPSIRVLIRRG